VQSAWSRIVLLQNFGDVPPPRRLRNTYLGNRGFNFLLLGPRGVPTHFCKCRPTSDMALRHEVAVLATLSRDPELSTAVPKTWGARSGRFQLLISAYVPGKSFARTVARLPTGRWAAAMTEILSVTHRVARKAAEMLPQLSGPRGRLGLFEAARGSLAHLASMGFGRRSVQALKDALCAGGCPHGFPQHGDLWPNNVVESGRSWWLLDFEMFGQVQVPLYDAWHLVRTCSDQRCARRASSTGSVWIDRLIADGDEAVACRRTIALVARQHALAPGEVIGTLVYYLIDIATRFHKRGGPQWYWEPHAREVQRLAEVLASGPRVERLIGELMVPGPNGEDSATAYSRC
jgi:hypothetical protein